MLNYSELRKHYKLYRQEREAADHAFVFAICVMSAALIVMVAIIFK